MARCPKTGPRSAPAWIRGRMSSVSDQLIGTITPRRWAAFVRNAFGPLALLADVFTIVAVAGLTGAIYHKLVYGAADESLYYFEVGAIVASIFALPNIFRGEYALSNYFSFRPHVRRRLHRRDASGGCNPRERAGRAWTNPSQVRASPNRNCLRPRRGEGGM